MNRLPRVFVLCVLSIAFLHSVAAAGIEGLTLYPPEAIDSGVLDVSSAGGPSAARTPDWMTGWPDEWHVVYAKNGDIYQAMRDASGWHTPERLTNDPAASRDPKVAFGAGVLLVVWEDERSGHPEIWSRRWNRSAWSAEECLTENAFNSRSASILGGRDGVVVAWQEESGFSYEIQERGFVSGAWNPTIEIAQGVFSASHPTLSSADSDVWYSHDIYWSDTRYGLAEIAGCEVQGGYPGREDRLTNLPGVCRGPSGSSLYDPPGIPSFRLIGFESVDGGVSETWIKWYNEYFYPDPIRISADDGISSERPSVAGIQYGWEGGGWWLGTREFVTYTDVPVTGPHSHRLAYVLDGDPAGEETISEAGVSHSTVAAGRGSPDSEILIQFIENREGIPTLIAQRGSIRSCFDPRFQFPAKIILAPEGIPSNLFVARDVCGSGQGIGGLYVNLRIDGQLEADLTWDVRQQHPYLPGQVTNSQGEARFAIKGGGCSDAGEVTYEVQMESISASGARSPDIDGDCAVRQNDLDYVIAHLGGTDPCADIDGSGIVDEGDLAIVQATLGDHCSQVSEADDAGAAAIDLRVAPNPCTERVAFYLKGMAPASLNIVDAGGRIVRSIGTVGADGGVVWNLRNNEGRRVAPGIYFAVIRTGSREEHRSVLVLR